MISLILYYEISQSQPNREKSLLGYAARIDNLTIGIYGER
jgi:hypothetical protein